MLILHFRWSSALLWKLLLVILVTTICICSFFIPFLVGKATVPEKLLNIRFEFLVFVFEVPITKIRIQSFFKFLQLFLLKVPIILFMACFPFLIKLPFLPLVELIPIISILFIPLIITFPLLLLAFKLLLWPAIVSISSWFIRILLFSSLSISKIFIITLFLDLIYQLVVSTV